MGDLPSVADLAQNGDVSGLCRHLDAGLNINDNNNQGIAGFHIAYNLGHKDFVCKLLHSGLSLEFVEISKLPFSYSLQSLPCVLFHKVYQEAVKIHGKRFKSLLDAVYKKDFDAMITASEKLLSTLKSHKSEGKYSLLSSTILFLLAYYRDCPEKLFKVFIRNGVDVNISFHGYPICVFAILCNNEKCLNVLLENGYCMDKLVHNVLSPFHYAIQLGYLDCLSVLLNQDHLFTLEVWKKDGAHMIEYAVKHRQHECLNLLLRRGAKANKIITDPHTDSALMLAVKHYDAATVDILLHYGADVSWVNDAHETPLMHAALRGCTDCLDLLISYRAEMNACDSYRESALMHALQRGKTSCVQRLLTVGADVSIVSIEDQTALTYAVALRDSACLELLLASEQFRLDTQVLNKWHKDAFLFCLRQFNIRYLVLLLEHGIFDWPWLTHCDPIPTELMAKAVVMACISPGCFVFKDEITTLFQIALKRWDIPTANYLMANLYFSEQDFQKLKRGESFLPYCSTSTHTKSEHILCLLSAFRGRPLQLQTLCLLTVSAALKSLACKRKKRRDLVNSLPIPERFKTVLKFETAVSGVCVNEWKDLGEDMLNKERSENPSCLLVPWKMRWIRHDVCKKANCCHDPAGYRKRHELLRKFAQARIRSTFPDNTRRRV